jgi:hypothetical protein
MSSARLQKLNALLKRVEARRTLPRLVETRAPAREQALAAPAPVARAAVIEKSGVEKRPPAQEPELFAETLPPGAPTIAPLATLPPAAGHAPSMRPDPTLAPNAEAGRRAPSSSPLEDAMALLGEGREDSGPLTVQPPAKPIQPSARPSLAEPQLNQDLLLTHRPEAGPAQTGPIIELVQPRAHGTREPTIQFDTGVKANPLTQRDLKPAGLVEPPVQSAPTGPTQKLEPLPLAAHAPPARVVSSARSEAAKTFGELLELSLSLRPTSQR